MPTAIIPPQYQVMIEEKNLEEIRLTEDNIVLVVNFDGILKHVPVLPEQGKKFKLTEIVMDICSGRSRH